MSAPSPVSISPVEEIVAEGVKHIDEVIAHKEKEILEV